MRKLFFSAVIIMASLAATAQELYVLSEPASNMPAHSITGKASMSFGRSHHDERQFRYVPEVMFGFSSKFMLHAGASFSNMLVPQQKWESVFLYAKYRFLSHDDVHRHFRMAVFADGSHSRNDYGFDDVNLQGERSGVQLGIIATQLIDKFAASATISHTQALDPSRFSNAIFIPSRTYQSINYSVSAGYLLLPREYRDFNQTNVNLYAELLGQQTLDRKTFYTDFAPSVQFIFNSNSKLNIGRRFQLETNQFRHMKNTWLISFEHTFFNALQ